MEDDKGKVVGHLIQMRFLFALKRKGNIPTAFLFTGPSSVGKRLVATHWIGSFFDGRSKILVCSGTHPDVLFLEGKEGEITIENVREIQEFVSRKALSGRKFVLIDEAHRMNEVAANSFLKTLEEPGKNTCFILISSRKEQILPTIRSRCIELKFSPLSRKELAQISRCDGMIYEGTAAPILDVTAEDLRELYQRFLTQVKGRPFILKDRDRLLNGFRTIAVFFHDILANRIAAEFSYGVVKERVNSIQSWVTGAERLFDLALVAEMGNLASIEADLSCRVRLSI